GRDHSRERLDRHDAVPLHAEEARLGREARTVERALRDDVKHGHLPGCALRDCPDPPTPALIHGAKRLSLAARSLRGHGTRLSRSFTFWTVVRWTEDEDVGGRRWAIPIRVRGRSFPRRPRRRRLRSAPPRSTPALVCPPGWARVSSHRHHRR